MVKQQPILKFFITVTFLSALVGTLFSCSQRGSLPQLTNPPPALFSDPLQLPINKKPFQVTEEDIQYTITPKFDYQLSGLIVSKRDHNTGLLTSLHRRWKDHLNTADICLIWGENIQTDLTLFEFSSGQFTCFYKTNSRDNLKYFDGNRLSNNHLILQDDYLRKQIARLNIGDVVTLKGWLADYRNETTGGERKTSTIRTDTGNGACETIWVTDVERLISYTDPWHQAFLACCALLALSIIAWFWAVGSGRI